MNIDDAPFDFTSMRNYMVNEHIVKRGINDTSVIEAMRSVPREYFVRPIDWDEAYEDSPLDVECGQTISQPYIVAYMTEILQVKKGMKVFEVGTGSGYQTAILSSMGAKVFSIERHEILSRGARDALKITGLIGNVTLKIADGSVGWKDHAPYDRIILTCCAPELVEELISQLAVGGIMISPVETSDGQVLRKVVKNKGDIEVTDDLPVRFVPLIGENGF